MSLADNKRGQLGVGTSDSERAAITLCGAAAEFIQTGQYEAARDALGLFWAGTGVRPDTRGLTEATAAEVLLQCGVLSGWLGTSGQVRGAQDAAKDLISEALRLFEARGERVRVAEAQYELGMCYWRVGAVDEGRVILEEAIRNLGDEDTELQAKILIRRTLIENSAGRYHESLRILNESESIFRDAPDVLKGRWHGQMALTLRRLGTSEGRMDYLDRAIIEYTAAIFHYAQAEHERYGATNENNLAFLLHKLGRHAQAHEHLDLACRKLARLKDTGLLAQVNETRAQVLLAEGRLEEASSVIAEAVETLEKGGEYALLARTLTVQATIQARLGQTELSLPNFRRAMNIAEDAGSLESAAHAGLAMIEEHGEQHLSENEIYNVYARADELLSRTQDMESITRLRECARITARRLATVRIDENFSLADAVRNFEARYIERALKEANGSVTHAAKRLGMKHQSLAYLLQARHENLLAVRTPAMPRRRSIIKR